MSDLDKKKDQEQQDAADAGAAKDEKVVEYVLDDFQLAPISSGEFVGDDELFARVDSDLNELFVIPEPATPAIISGIVEEKPVDPIFDALAAPVLPELERENRARLQMQSPNRLYFYWSVKNNPFQTLKRVFRGAAVDYRLVARLVELETEREVLHPVEAEGSWWYNVESASRYRAEIGFYAPTRPFVRVMFSNTVETPRKSPSPRQATDADWAINAYEFAEVLDNAGFTRDAFEVALAGDDHVSAETATDNAFYQILGHRVEGFSADEVRYAMLALASGVDLGALRGQISEGLYLVLAENAGKLGPAETMTALREHFDLLDEEILEFEESGEPVYGASLVHFPKRRVSRAVPKATIPTGPVRFVPRLSPVSSLRF